MRTMRPSPAVVDLAALLPIGGTAALTMPRGFTKRVATLKCRTLPTLGTPVLATVTPRHPARIAEGAALVIVVLVLIAVVVAVVVVVVVVVVVAVVVDVVGLVLSPPTPVSGCSVIRVPRAKLYTEWSG